MNNTWPYSYILKRIQQATEEARQQGLRPILAKEAVRNFRTSRRFNIPYLGDYVPDGWTLDGPAYYVCTAGKPNRSTSISLQELYRHLREQMKDETIGYGVLEQGQIRVLIAIYRKETNEETKNRH